MRKTPKQIKDRAIAVINSLLDQNRLSAAEDDYLVLSEKEWDRAIAVINPLLDQDRLSAAEGLNQIKKIHKGDWLIKFGGPMDPKSAEEMLGELHWSAIQDGGELEVLYPDMPLPPPKEPSAESRLSYAVGIAEDLCAAFRREKPTPYWIRNLCSPRSKLPDLSARDNGAIAVWCLGKLARTLEALKRNTFYNFGLWRTGAYRFWDGMYENAHLAAEDNLWRLAWDVVSCLRLTKKAREELISSSTDLNQCVSKLCRRIGPEQRRALHKAATKWPAPTEWNALDVEMAVERARETELAKSPAATRRSAALPPADHERAIGESDAKQPQVEEFQRFFKESQKYKRGPRTRAERTQRRDELITQAIGAGISEPEQVFDFVKGQNIELVKRGKSFIDSEIMMKNYWKRQRAKSQLHQGPAQRN